MVGRNHLENVESVLMEWTGFFAAEINFWAGKLPPLLHAVVTFQEFGKNCLFYFIFQFPLLILMQSDCKNRGSSA